MSAFDDLYYASRDPRVIALKDLPISEKLSAANALTNNGTTGPIIDTMIDLYGQGPEIDMSYRKYLGLPWIPSFGQPGLVNPFGLGTEIPTDMTKPWPRSIKTSLDPTDYPPFTPVVKPPVIPVRPVGVKNGDTFVANLSVIWVNGQWLFQDGQKYSQDGIEYLFHNVPGMFGPMTWWTLV